MSKGIRIHSDTEWSELENLIGYRIFQISCPSDKYNGYVLYNFNAMLTSLHLDKEKPGMVGLRMGENTEILWIRSAVLTFEESAMEAIGEFVKSNEKDSSRTD